MSEPSGFMLLPKPLPWRGGEPRVFAVDEEDKFPEGLPSISEVKLVDVRYDGGGLTKLLDDIASLSGVTRGGGLQATLENLEDITHGVPLVIIVRDADRLLADISPAPIHLTTGWEGFTHHGNGISAMYLVLETGPRAVTNGAFYPGGIVDWIRK